ncbi:DUF3995 domain-containing protein [Cognatiyoonia sp. IB215446]|uniref:DUF3995 domain-containing protein n=1 Tax=Cognatiyoonia sp. IB215446 TaxID=3097355 RepID=UPI002A0F0364|nr:DUF3995 domain-containing protein [Cognatiyoonia sp. IB215446]MDX8347091.1 DUF3995 domain-containing protein [Cognatiyoonia sp. IB215446]
MTVLLTLILGLIAVIHALWGLQIWVPIRDEEELARTVVGAKGVTRMPGAIPCFLVVAALLVIIAALWLPRVLLLQIILWGAFAVFLLRGAIAYTKFWRMMTPEQPFAANDRKYYAPLCLVIAAGLLTVLLGG